MEKTYAIRSMEPNQLQEALQLAWKVFSEYEAPEYAQGGIQEFQRYLSLPDMRERVEIKGFLVWVCMAEETIVGMLGASPAPEGSHINLLFVDGAHHRKGIARALFQAMLTHCLAQDITGKIAVNSSPYAVEAYRRLGFQEIKEEQTVNGIRFIPMERPL